MGWLDRFRQQGAERASYETFVRWQEGAGPRDEAEARRFSELDDQYSWDETPQEEPGPPPWEPVEWSKADLGASERLMEVIGQRRELREAIQAAGEKQRTAPDGRAYLEAYRDRLEATDALLHADGELGEATSAFDQVREAAQAERAAQQARDHEQAGDPRASTDGTAGADPGADREAGS